jgi:ATP-dependent Clp protease protease subunit
MNEILADHTGRSVEEIARDTERDYYMSGEEALAYGVIDKVVQQHEANESGAARGNGSDGGGKNRGGKNR